MCTSRRRHTLRKRLYQSEISLYNTDSTRLGKFIFVKESKFLLFQAVLQQDIHRALQKKKDEYVKKVVDTVISNLQYCVKRGSQKPTKNKVGDKLLSVLSDRREENGRNISRSRNLGDSRVIRAATRRQPSWLSLKPILQTRVGRESRKCLYREGNLLSGFLCHRIL